MTEIVFQYIKILLPRHRCVTLPGLGAFIMNNELQDTLSPKSREEILLPSCTISFNSRLQHDDGVLSTHIQTINGISYEKASKELANTIRSLRTNLLLNKVINCGSLGKIELIDSNIIFTQNKDYIFPQHYGLSPIGLTTITSITKDIDKEVKTVSLKKRVITISASAAVALLLILPSTNITDSTSLSNEQQAGYLKSLVTTAVESPVVEQQEQAIIEELDIEAAKESVVVKAIDIEQPRPIASERSYYLIIGGEATANRAERTLDKFKEEGFTTAKVLEAPQRYRIYIESFDNKAAAENYLVQFRKDNPKYESAWIHSRKN